MFIVFALWTLMQCLLPDKVFGVSCFLGGRGEEGGRGRVTTIGCYQLVPRRPDHPLKDLHRAY